MKKILPIFTLLFVFCLFLTARADEPQNPTVLNIQRTMKALEESTAENPAHVRIMFYGQSIVAQQWTGIIQKKFQEKYPTVKFTFVNKAIGGFSSERLVRTAEEDLYPWYPDLIFFHVYGSLEKYEEIVKNIRERTSAEIILWTSHLSRAHSAKEMSEKRDERSLGIMEVAKKYDTMFVDLNQKWYEMLLERNMEAGELLVDTVHLNPRGVELYARYLWEEIVRVPGTSGTEASGKIQTVSLDDSAVKKNADGSMELTFTGNRVCAVCNGKGAEGATATILLDGKNPVEFKELWTHTRPSTTCSWMPAICTIGWNVPLVKEDWELHALPDSEKDGSKIHYTVKGSVTGEDGEGWSNADFTSKSGRVTILASDYQVGQHKYFKVPLKDDYVVKWSSVTLYADPFQPAAEGERVLLLENCTNETHTLTILPQGGDLGISAFEINTPKK